MKRLITGLLIAALALPVAAQVKKPSNTGTIHVAMANAYAGLVVQNAPNAADNSLQLTISADKQQVKRGENVNLTVTVKNQLSPLPPIQLQATATYTTPTGETVTVQSNVVTLQPIQPIQVGTVDISLPAGWIVVSGTLPINFGATLLEGQSVSNTITIRRQ